MSRAQKEFLEATVGLIASFIYLGLFALCVFGAMGDIFWPWIPFGIINVVGFICYYIKLGEVK